jgi:flagellar basal-body rod protein FlgG
MTQGNLQQTGKELDVSIRGEGFFSVQTPDGQTAYTRDGSFELDANGNLVTLDGFQVQPNITVPNNARSITINREGEVQALLDTSTTPTNLGQIQLSRFVNKAGLQSIGDNLYLETPASGTAIDGTADTAGFGSISQNFLENSNVNAVSELSDLISAQRAYEMNAKVISASDEMMQASASIVR